MKTIRIITSVLLTLALCFSLAACGSDENEGTTPPAEGEVSTASSTGTTERTTAGAPEIPTQEMCWQCGEQPVSGNSAYCYNCKCMLCDNMRKLGGDYMFCTDHNCNESLCTAQCVDNSQYCVAHKCEDPNCRNERWPGSEYCSVHK